MSGCKIKVDLANAVLNLSYEAMKERVRQALRPESGEKKAIGSESKDGNETAFI